MTRIPTILSIVAGALALAALLDLADSIALLAVAVLVLAVAILVDEA